MALRVTAAAPDPDLLFLPWNTPLEQWPAEDTVALPRGISRHTVRFIRSSGVLYAVKETLESTARREYELLFELGRLGAPCVEPAAIIAGREDDDGEPIQSALITRHLSYSLPYRALAPSMFTGGIGERLLDALVLLIVRLHLLGFAWNDCSLSNTLFVRDAGEFAAYLVDAETGDLREQLSRGQRAYDIDTATLNITGELMDLQAGGLIPDHYDPTDLGVEFQQRYEHLWMTLTEPMVISGQDRHHLHTLLRTLNGLGFDVAEMSVESVEGGAAIKVQPKVVDAGHHQGRMLRETGLQMQENQARKLLNDLDAFRALHDPDEEEQVVAHRWVAEVYEAILRRIPRDLRRKHQAPELVYEVLQHCWASSERAGHDVGLAWATDDFVANDLMAAPDETAVLGSAAGDVGSDDVDADFDPDLDPPPL